MSFSLRWLHLTNVTTAASVELLLIYIGLPSETHPVTCLGCIQATSGKVSLAGGKLKRDYITNCSFPQHRAQLSLSPEGRETTGCSEFLHWFSTAKTAIWQPGHGSSGGRVNVLPFLSLPSSGIQRGDAGSP